MRALSLLFSPILLATSAAFAADPPSFTLEELVAKHDAMLQRIPCIDVEMHQTLNKFKAGEPFESTETYSWRWSRTPHQQRLQIDFPPAPGLLEWWHPQSSFQDMHLQGKQRRRLLYGRDRARLQAITSRNPQGIGAAMEMLKPDDRPFPWSPEAALLWHFDPFDAKGMTLAELVAASDDAHLVGPLCVNEQEIWRIHLTVPSPDANRRPVTFDIDIDPAAHFAIRQYVETRDDLPTDVDGMMERTHAKTTGIVERFQPAGASAVLPARIHMSVVADTSDRRSMTIERRFQLFSTDCPQVEKAAAFSFPKDIIVTEFVDGPNGRMEKQWLWGPNNQPAREIQNPSDIPAAEESSLFDLFGD